MFHVEQLGSEGSCNVPRGTIWRDPNTCLMFHVEHLLCVTAGGHCALRKARVQDQCAAGGGEIGFVDGPGLPTGLNVLKINSTCMLHSKILLNGKYEL